VRVAGLSTPPNPLHRGQIAPPAAEMPGGQSGDTGARDPGEALAGIAAAWRSGV